MARKRFHKNTRKKPIRELRLKMGSYSPLVKTGIGITAGMVQVTLLFEPSPSVKDHGDSTFSEQLLSELNQNQGLKHTLFFFFFAKLRKSLWTILVLMTKQESFIRS